MSRGSPSVSLTRRRTASVVVVLLASLYASACGDSATHLAGLVERATRELSTRATPSVVTTTFEPIAGHARPYTMVFFPTKPVTRDDLVRAGVAMDTAERIVSELGYLGTTSDRLVVAQEGQRLAFTSTCRTTPRHRGDASRGFARSLRHLAKRIRPRSFCKGTTVSIG